MKIGLKTQRTMGLAVALVALMSTSAGALPSELILARNFETGARVALAPDGSWLSPLACAGDLTRGPGSPRWFVDAKAVGDPYSFHTQLFAYDEDCTVEIRLTSDEYVKRRGPMWSPDGLRVAYSGERYHPSTGVAIDRGIFVADVVRDLLTGAPASVANERLAVSLNSEPAVSWASDSCRLAYALETWSGQGDIYVADVCAAAATPTNVTATAALYEFGPPVFHPLRTSNGEPTADRIAFARRIEKNGSCCRTDIFVLDLATGTTSQVTSKNNANPDQIFGPAWSPTGAYLAFGRRGPRGGDSGRDPAAARVLRDGWLPRVRPRAALP